MRSRAGEIPRAWRKLFLTMAGVVTLAVPLVVGLLTERLLAPSPAVSADRPAFDVASIKSNKANNLAVLFGVGAGRGGGKNVTLKILIGLAYRLQQFQISGGPSWVSSDRFDVEGKTENRKADPDQLRLMLQSLLEDRFKLKLHRETKEASVYALVVGKDGSKIKLSSDQTSPDVNGPAPPGAGPNHGAINIGAGSLIGNAVTMALFTRFLSQRLDRSIIDKTNLTGRFDIQLQWTPGLGENPVSPAGYPLPPPADSSGLSIFTAIQEQLGLRLESTKGPVEVFVIDHVEQPSEN